MRTMIRYKNLAVAKLRRKRFLVPHVWQEVDG